MMLHAHVNGNDIRSVTVHVHVDVYVCTLGHGRGVCH